MQKLINGDCLESLKLIYDNSVDLVLIDPPYSSGGCLRVIARLTHALNTVTTTTTGLIAFRLLRAITWTSTRCWLIGLWFSAGSVIS